jgi:hypothetical protein
VSSVRSGLVLIRQHGVVIDVHQTEVVGRGDKALVS